MARQRKAKRLQDAVRTGSIVSERSWRSNSCKSRGYVASDCWSECFVIRAVFIDAHQDLHVKLACRADLPVLGSGSAALATGSCALARCAACSRWTPWRLARRLMLMLALQSDKDRELSAAETAEGYQHRVAHSCVSASMCNTNICSCFSAGTCTQTKAIVHAPDAWCWQNVHLGRQRLLPWNDERECQLLMSSAASKAIRAASDMFAVRKRADLEGKHACRQALGRPDGALSSSTRKRSCLPGRAHFPELNSNATVMNPSAVVR
jgi:hypothetical protein